MRLTGGDGKGRRLLDPPEGVRPTSSRVRETLFQILVHHLKGRRVLDLFAGSGSLGLEALARGAGETVFVERDRKVLRILQQNIERCGFQNRVTVQLGTIPEVLVQNRIIGPFDLVLADPPYAEDPLQEVLKAIREHELISVEGQVVFEVSSKSDPAVPDGWQMDRKKVIGDTALLFLTIQE
jgi:16S rRNA (guanine966-N2)-methyltransferase